MLCVSEYPAEIDAYGNQQPALRWGISDHTIGLDLWRKYRPAFYEKHFALEDSTGPDAGPWAATPDELREVFA
jgi:sialic acid synthase SpsE